MSITTSPLMSDEQFAALCEHVAGPSGVNGREEKKIVKTERGKPKIKKDFVWNCDNTLRHTIAWMKAHDIQNIRANIERIADFGGYCDCEVLFNAAARWEEEKNAPIDGPSYMEGGKKEWNKFIDNLIANSTEE